MVGLTKDYIELVEMEVSWTYYQNNDFPGMMFQLKFPQKKKKGFFPCFRS